MNGIIKRNTNQPGAEEYYQVIAMGDTLLFNPRNQPEGKECWIESDTAINTGFMR